MSFRKNTNDSDTNLTVTLSVLRICPNLIVARYSAGNAGDSLTPQNGNPFLTQDRDFRGCARVYLGAWWCRPVTCDLHNHPDPDAFYSHLNGPYTPVTLPRNSRAFGLQWFSFSGDFNPLSFSEMKLRRRD